MAYRFDPAFTLQENLRSTAADQAEKAIASLDSAENAPEAAIHDLRKRMKKLRGLLRLLRPGLGKLYKTENRLLRDTARQFSGVRDAQVMVRTAEWLEAEAGGGLAPLCDWARERRKKALAPAPGISGAREDLAALRERIPEWELSGGQEALAAGLAKTYGRARKGFETAQAGPAPGDLHQWRKRLKYHRYHCRLLKPAWPDAIGGRADLTHRVAVGLGEDHDLQVLRDALDGAGLAPDVVQLASQASQRLGQARRADALAAAPLLFVEKPKRLGRRLAALWACAAAAAQAEPR